MGGCTLGGSASHDRNPLVPHPHSLCPFSSHSCALFCTFLHSRKFQLLYFQEIPYSLAKKTGGWGFRWFPQWTRLMPRCAVLGRSVRPTSIAERARPEVVLCPRETSSMRLALVFSP